MQVRKHYLNRSHIEFAFLPLDLCEEAIKIAQVRHVFLCAGYISSDPLHCRGQLRITTPLMKMYAPSFTNYFAVERPMPLSAPVMSAIFPSSLP